MKILGRIDSPVRTPEQSNIARLRQAMSAIDEMRRVCRMPDAVLPSGMTVRQRIPEWTQRGLRPPLFEVESGQASNI